MVDFRLNKTYSFVLYSHNVLINIVEYIDIWTWWYSLVCIYRIREQKLTGHYRLLVLLSEQLENRTINVGLFRFLPNLTLIFSFDMLYIIYVSGAAPRFFLQGVQNYRNAIPFHIQADVSRFNKRYRSPRIYRSGLSVSFYSSYLCF